MNEIRNYKDERRERWETKMENRDGSSHIWTGLFLLAIGGLALARSMGAPIPNWLFSWQMLVIAIGLFIGFKKGFRDGGWFIPVIIGGFFLVNEFVLQGEMRRHIWPMILIVIGIFCSVESLWKYRWPGMDGPDLFSCVWHLQYSNFNSTSQAQQNSALSSLSIYALLLV